MKTSTNRILTTHVGSMVRPPEIQELMRKGATDEGLLKQSVAEVVRKQAEVGIDIPSDGEYSKSSFSNYANERLSGFEVVEGVPSVTGRGRDRTAFADFYLEYEGPAATSSVVCTGPVKYTGLALLHRDIANFKAAMAGAGVEEAFIVEHPELVAQRLVRFAGLVGWENVIAGCDCGFSQGALNPRVHASIMWAKFDALAKGAALASKELWR